MRQKRRARSHEITAMFFVSVFKITTRRGANRTANCHQLFYQRIIGGKIPLFLHSICKIRKEMENKILEISDKLNMFVFWSKINLILHSFFIDFLAWILLLHPRNWPIFILLKTEKILSAYQFHLHTIIKFEYTRVTLKSKYPKNCVPSIQFYFLSKN